MSRGPRRQKTAQGVPATEPLRRAGRTEHADGKAVGSAMGTARRVGPFLDLEIECGRSRTSSSSRPVLAVVINLVILAVGLAGHQQPAGAPVPPPRVVVDHHHDG